MLEADGGVEGVLGEVDAGRVSRTCLQTFEPEECISPHMSPIYTNVSVKLAKKNCT